MTRSPDSSADDAHRAAVDGFADFTYDDAYDASDEESAGPVTRGGSAGRFMVDLADTLRDAGSSVEEYNGWKDRGRRGRGLTAGPLAIIVHHTASGRSSDGRRDVEYMTTEHQYAPLANLYLDRRGTWWVLAAGATNTNGRGGPWGPLPLNGANVRVIGIEAANNGTGEPWSNAMQDALVTGVAALADRHEIDIDNVLSHQEWAPTRKIDPAGPSRFGSINHVGSWDMNEFRSAVNTVRRQPGSVKAIRSTASADDGGTYVVRSGDAWWSIAEKTMGNPTANWKTLADANGGPERVLLAGAVLTIPGGSDTLDSSVSTATATFPGEAKRGMKGPIVLAWQEALIAHGVIADTTGNHDGDYGEGMERAVLELQQSWNWSDADGIAGSGTWKKLHS